MEFLVTYCDDTENSADNRYNFLQRFPRVPELENINESFEINLTPERCLREAIKIIAMKTPDKA